MLQNNPRNPRNPEDFVEADDDGFDLDHWLSVARRRWRVVVVCAVAGVLLGYGYLATAIPLYTATVTMLIDSPEGRQAQQVSGIAETLSDSSTIDSQVELIRSESIAALVEKHLNLSENPLFMQQEPTPTERVMGWVTSGLAYLFEKALGFGRNDMSEPDLSMDMGSGDVLQDDALQDKAPPSSPLDQAITDPEFDLTRQTVAVGTLMDALAVNRVDRTFALQISYTSSSPQLAAEIANGYAAVYIDDQLESKYEATRRASDWLLNRTEELKQKSKEAELAVEAYRKEHGLVASSGTLISDQQLSGLNAQLIIARGDVAKAEARYKQLKTIVDAGDVGAAASETVSQSITSELRSRYLEASKRLSEISSLLGPNHAQTVRIRNEMFQLQRLMFEELKRSTEVARNDLAVARDRVTALESDLQKLVGTTNAANETQVQLRELERNAESVQSLYRTFLQRYQESLQTQSFPISDARIITQAKPPRFASYPRRSRTLVLALFLGGALGVGFALLGEFRDRVFRTGDQVRDELALEFIGMLPIIGIRDRRTKPKRTRRRQDQTKPARMAPTVLANTLSSDRTLKDDSSEELTASPASAEMLDLVDLPELQGVDTVMRYTLNAPLSGFAETLRGAKVAVDLTLAENSCKVVGIVSALPGEGKSTVAKNLSSLVANQGASVILIDADIRNPGLTRACAKDAEFGLVEVLTDEASWQAPLRREAESGLLILPTVVKRHMSHTADLLSSQSMRKLLAECRSSFDYVFVDLPPVGPVVDARAVLPYLDCVLVVIEWGKTNRKMISQIFLDDARLHEKSIGAVFNKVDKDKLKMYEGYHSKNYYYSRYKKYYTH